VTEQVYTLLRERAARILASGRSVILDATFRARRQRTLFCEQATKLGSQVLFLDCQCTRQTALERLHARARTPGVSDGRAEIYDALAASSEAADELPASAHVVIDTNLAAASTLEVALRRLS
jgi:predicted kinase